MSVQCPSRARRATAWLLCATAAVLAGCVDHHARPDAAASHWQHARQLVLVTSADWNADHGTLRTFERDGDHWREVGSAQPVTIGRAGAAWGLGLHPESRPGPHKREGDGRAPAGVFAVGDAFGYAASADTALRYQPMRVSDWCIDVSDSPLYNRIVDADVVGTDAIAGSSEPMRRDLHADGDSRYRLGFVIEHNPRARPGAGSCIFAHLWKDPETPTAGCTAMDATAMRALLAWLQPDRQPVFVLLPRDEYRRHQAAWQLPALEQVR